LIRQQKKLKESEITGLIIRESLVQAQLGPHTEKEEVTAM
jgi:hypothetical protein